MSTPPRLAPLLEQYDHATERLLARLRGPTIDSGDGEEVAVPALTDEEYCGSRRPAPGPSAARPTDPAAAPRCSSGPVSGGGMAAGHTRIHRP